MTGSPRSTSTTAPSPPGQLVPNSFPQGTWMRMYLDNVMNVTEAPWMFHIMGGLAALGGAWGRMFAIPWGDYTIHGNVHVLWLGPSGCGKTQAYNVALDTLRMARPDLTIIQNEATPVGIIRRVGEDEDTVREQQIEGTAEDSEFVFAAGEMSTIVNKLKNSEGMLPMLTDMMDNPSSYERTTAGRGVDFLYRPTPTALMCSTEAWVHAMMPAGLFEGGFMSRVIPTVAKGKARMLPIPAEMDDAKRREAGLALRRMRIALPKLVFKDLSPEVLRAYTRWYNDLHGVKPDDSRLDGWQARVHGHLLKIAGLLAVSAAWRGLGKEQPQITLGTLKLASRVLAEIQPGLEALIQGAVATNFEGMRTKVLRAVARAGREGANRGELLNVTQLRPRDLDEVLDALKEGKEIAVKPGTAGDVGARYRHPKYRR